MDLAKKFNEFIEEGKLTQDAVVAITNFASAFEYSGSPALSKRASVLDEILLTIASPKNALAEFKAKTDAEVERLRDKYRSLQLEEQYTKAKKALDINTNKEAIQKAVKDQVKEYRVMEAPLQTRYSPDHHGVQMLRIADGVFQDPITGKVFDFREGYTKSNGDKVPGGSVENQTQMWAGRDWGSPAFSTRDAVVSRFAKCVTDSGQINKTAFKQLLKGVKVAQENLDNDPKDYLEYTIEFNLTDEEDDLLSNLAEEYEFAKILYDNIKSKHDRKKTTEVVHIKYVRDSFLATPGDPGDLGKVHSQAFWGYTGESLKEKIEKLFDTLQTLYIENDGLEELLKEDFYDKERDPDYEGALENKSLEDWQTIGKENERADDLLEEMEKDNSFADDNDPKGYLEDTISFDLTDEEFNKLNYLAQKYAYARALLSGYNHESKTIILEEAKDAFLLAYEGEYDPSIPLVDGSLNEKLQELFSTVWEVHIKNDDVEELLKPENDVSYAEDNDPNDYQEEQLPFDLSDEEVDSLGYIADRYESARILYDNYDDEKKSINVKAVRDAFLATPGDGGDLGTVPLAGGSLKKKIWDLFGAVEKLYIENDDLEELLSDNGFEDDLEDALIGTSYEDEELSFPFKDDGGFDEFSADDLKEEVLTVPFHMTYDERGKLSELATYPIDQSSNFSFFNFLLDSFDNKNNILKINTSGPLYSMIVNYNGNPFTLLDMLPMEGVSVDLIRSIENVIDEVMDHKYPNEKNDSESINYENDIDYRNHFYPGKIKE